MHSCTCPFIGIPSVENNRSGAVAVGQGIAEMGHVFCSCFVRGKNFSDFVSTFSNFFSIPWFIIIFLLNFLLRLATTHYWFVVILLDLDLQQNHATFLFLIKLVDFLSSEKIYFMI